MKLRMAWLVQLAWVVAGSTVLAAAVHLYGVFRMPGERVLAKSDFEPVLVAIHNAWLATPEKRPASDGLRNFQAAAQRLGTLSQSLHLGSSGPRSELSELKRSLEAAIERVDSITNGTGTSAEDPEALASLREASQTALLSLAALSMQVDEVMTEAVEANEAGIRLEKELGQQDAGLAGKLTEVEAAVRATMKQVSLEREQTWMEVVGKGYGGVVATVADLARQLFVWQFIAVLAGLWFLARVDGEEGKRGLLGILRTKLAGVQSIRAPGAELVFSGSEADKLTEDATAIFASYRRKAAEQLARIASDELVASRLEFVVKNGIYPWLATRMLDRACRQLTKTPSQLTEGERQEVDAEVQRRKKGLRFTIHVEDLLFAQSLSQLVPYFATGGGAGRAWTVRFGMIGRSWRLNQSRSETRIPSERKELMKNWGMTPDQVDRFVQSGRRSFTCIVLKSENAPTAILYMDSEVEDVFDFENLGYDGQPNWEEAKASLEKENFHKEVVDWCNEHLLTAAIGRVTRQIESRRSRIRLFDEDSR